VAFTIYGASAVTFMLVTYAMESRRRHFCGAFALGCSSLCAATKPRSQDAKCAGLVGTWSIREVSRGFESRPVGLRPLATVDSLQLSPLDSGPGASRQASRQSWSASCSTLR
jgi:hypothetical protein